MGKERVVFYSEVDMARFFMKEKVEKVLDSFEEDDVFDNINDVIELYHVKLYVDSNVYLHEWGEGRLSSYKMKVVQMWKLINLFFKSISDNNILAKYGEIDCANYTLGFWQLMEKCRIYKQISAIKFVELFECVTWKNEILQQKTIVSHYNIVLRDLLISYDGAAELLIDNYVVENKLCKSKLYFPASLTIKDKEGIIVKYIKSDEANLNYIRLVSIAKDSTEFKLSDMTRLNAQRRYEADEDFLKANNSIALSEHSIAISFSPTQIEPKKESYQEDCISLVYSLSWIKKNSHPVVLFQNFQYLFGHLDEQFRISLVPNIKDVSFIDLIKIKANYEYADSYIFNLRNDIALGQMMAYSNALQSLGISLEQVIETAFNIFVKEHSIENLFIKLKTPNEELLSLIRCLIPEMDAILKRYKLYVENGEVDVELLAISSSSPGYKDLPSMVKKKYVISNEDVVGKVMNILFSNQSLCHFIDGKYNSLFDILRKEQVVFDDVEDDYTKTVLRDLIESEYLLEDHGILKFRDEIEICVLHDLYYNSTISFWHLGFNERSTIDRMRKENKVYLQSSLFTDEEANYFEYCLKSTYSNGQELRNKYIHGAYTASYRNIEKDYYKFLQLFVLMLWKIIDDILCMKKESSNT